MFIFQVTLNPPPRQTRGSVTPVPTVAGPLANPPSGPLSPAPLPPRRGLARIIRFDTLAGQFSSLVLLAVVLCGVGLIAAYFVLNSIANNFKEVISNSSPSIIAAENLGQAAQNADAAAANYQLYSRVDVNSPDFDPRVYGDTSGQAQCKIGLRNCAWQSFLTSRQQVDDALYKARANITYPGEADAINAISNRFLDYVGLINVMKHELDLGHREAALAAYKAAHDILVGNLGSVTLDAQGHSPEEQVVLNNIDGFNITNQYVGIQANIRKLSEINRRALNSAYNQETNSITFGTVLVIILGVLLVASLLFLSVRYALITHRVINPGYALALIGAIALTAILALSLLHAKTDYKTVGQDSFASIESVARARQLAADSNADESRLLLSPEGPGLDSTNPNLTSDVRVVFAKKNLQADFDTKKSLISDTLVTTWQNLSYPQERNALCKVSQNLAPTNPTAGGDCSDTSFAYTDFLNVDNTIRDDFNKNLLADAIKLDTNTATGGSQEAFNRMDTALVEVSRINEREFDQSACNAYGTVEFGSACNSNGYLVNLEVGVLIVFPLIALAAIGGFFFARRRF